MQGCCAETGGSIMLFVATELGIPVSTTHTITGSIIGVGAAKRVSAVRWSVAQGIVIAWVITIPAAGLDGGAVLFRWRACSAEALRDRARQKMKPRTGGSGLRVCLAVFLLEVPVD